MQFVSLSRDRYCTRGRFCQDGGKQGAIPDTEDNDEILCPLIEGCSDIVTRYGVPSKCLGLLAMERMGNESYRPHLSTFKYLHML